MSRRICLAMVLVVMVVVVAAIATGGAPNPSVTPRSPCIQLVSTRPAGPAPVTTAGACRIDRPDLIDA